MCSVIDSSMPVHSKAGGNFLLFGDSEGGDTNDWAGHSINYRTPTCFAHTRDEHIPELWYDICTHQSFFASYRSKGSSTCFSNCYQLHLMPVKKK